MKTIQWLVITTHVFLYVYAAGNVFFDPINNEDCANFSEGEATGASVNSQKTNVKSKRCLSCNDSGGPKGKKLCRRCEANKDEEQIAKMKKTNPSKQFGVLRRRAKILNYHHDWHIVVFVCHKHARGHTFTTYGTPGIGEEFIGSHENPTPTGKAVFDVFRSFTKQELNKQENVAAETTTSLQRTDNTRNINNATYLSLTPANESPKVPTGIVSSPFSEQPNVHPTSSAMSSTSSLPTDSLKAPETTPPSKALPPPQPGHPNPCLSSSLTSAIQLSIPNTPAITACAIFEQPTLPDPPEDAVIVVDKEKFVAMGKVVDLPTIHGVPIPKNHLCLVLSWAAENHPAPCPLGRKDLDENQLLHNNMFCAFPKTMLKRFIKKDSKYFLLPLN